MFKMRQSDHRPVGALFKVKTNVPFLNVVRKGNFYGSENCDVHFGSVSFNFNEELATTDQSVLDAADDEDDGGNSNNNNNNNNNNDIDKSKFQRKSSTPADKKKKISASGGGIQNQSNECPHCNKKINGYGSRLKRHIQSVHEKISTFTCEKCQKQFRDFNPK